MRQCNLLIAFFVLLLTPSHSSLAQQAPNVTNAQPSNRGTSRTAAIELNADIPEIVLSQGDIALIRVGRAKGNANATATATATFANVDSHLYFVATVVKANGDETEVGADYVSGKNVIKYPPQNHFSTMGDGDVKIMMPVGYDSVEAKGMHIRIRHMRQTIAFPYESPKACKACDVTIPIKQNDIPEYTLTGNKDGSLSVRGEGAAHIVKYEAGRSIPVENEGRAIPLPDGSIEIGIRQPLPSVDGRKKFQEVRVKVSAPVEADEIPQSVAANGGAAVTSSFGSLSSDEGWNVPDFGPRFTLQPKETNSIADALLKKKIKILSRYTVDTYKRDGNGVRVKNRGMDYSNSKCVSINGGDTVTVKGIGVRKQKKTYWLEVTLSDREKKLCGQDVAYLPICTLDQSSGVVKECGPWPWFMIQTNGPPR